MRRNEWCTWLYVSKKVGYLFITSLFEYFLLTHKNVELLYNFTWKNKSIGYGFFFPPKLFNKGTWIPPEKAGLNLRFSIREYTHLLLVFRENMFKETLKETGYFNQWEKGKNDGNLYLLIYSTKIAFARQSYFTNKRYIPSVSLRILLYIEENVSILLQCNIYVT